MMAPQEYPPSLAFTIRLPICSSLPVVGMRSSSSTRAKRFQSIALPTPISVSSEISSQVLPASFSFLIRLATFMST
jgi:hypothetical protein